MIIERSRTKSSGEAIAAVEKAVDEFAKQGTRTLCIGYRKLQKSLFTKWKAKRKDLEAKADE